MIWRRYGRFFIYLTDKVDEPEKTTGPSGCEAFLPLIPPNTINPKACTYGRGLQIYWNI